MRSSSSLYSKSRHKQGSKRINASPTQDASPPAQKAKPKDKPPVPSFVTFMPSMSVPSTLLPLAPSAQTPIPMLNAVD